MKKKYFAPETLRVTIELQWMVAESTFSTGKDTQSITISENEEADEFTSRQYDIWQDDLMEE